MGTKWFDHKQGEPCMVELPNPPSLPETSKKDIFNIETGMTNADLFAHICHGSTGNFIVIHIAQFTIEDLERWYEDVEEEMKTRSRFPDFVVFMECTYEDCKTCDDVGCKKHPKHILTY